MLIALIACVTEASFPERFAGALCDYHAACNGRDEWAPDGAERDACVTLYATEEAPDYMVCHEDFPADLAAACIREIEDDTDVEHGGGCEGGAAWPSCEAMHCGVT